MLLATIITQFLPLINNINKNINNKNIRMKHIDINEAVDLIKDFNIEVKVGSRVYDVLALPDQKVETWSKSYNYA